MNWKRIFFWRKKVDVQDVFDRVIDAGFYSPGNTYMCLALNGARSCGAISGRECGAAKKHISKYLGRDSALWKALWKRGLPYSYWDTLKIYRDWANRPKLKRW